MKQAGICLRPASIKLLRMPNYFRAESVAAVELLVEMPDAELGAEAEDESVPAGGAGDEDGGEVTPDGGADWGRLGADTPATSEPRPSF